VGWLHRPGARRRWLASVFFDSNLHDPSETNSTNAVRLTICRGHFPLSGRRCEIQLEKPLHSGHFKPAAVYNEQAAAKGKHWQASGTQAGFLLTTGVF
jgi:hypothetical protein